MHKVWGGVVQPSCLPSISTSQVLGPQLSSRGDDVRKGEPRAGLPLVRVSCVHAARIGAEFLPRQESSNLCRIPFFFFGATAMGNVTCLIEGWSRSNVMIKL